MDRAMRIVFIGCVESSYHFLSLLLKEPVDICGVVTKQSSAMNSDFVDLSGLCEANGIEAFYFSKEKEADFEAYIERKRPDAILCLGWSHLLSANVIRIPPLGVLGFHPAALPNNRGRHPLIWALVLGLTETASTFFMIDEGTDTGRIVSQRPVQIEESDDAGSLYHKVLDIAGNQLIEIIRFLSETGAFPATASADLPPGNVWRKRTPADGQIDFRMSAKCIYNLVRALTRPYVGAHFMLHGQAYRVWKCEALCDAQHIYDNLEFGKVLRVASPTDFVVKTGDGLVHITDCDSVALKEGAYLL